MNQNKVNISLALLQFLHFFLWGSWFVTAGTYMLQNLQFTGNQVGMIYATSAIAATLSPLITGIIADRLFSIERILFILYLVGGALMWLLSGIETFNLFYLVVLVYMLFFLPAFSLVNALCFHHIQDSRKDYPKIRVWGTIAWITAGLMVGFLDIEDSVIPIKIAGSLSFVLAIYCFTLPHTPPHKGEGSFLDTLKSPELQSLLRDKSFVVLITSIALICIPTSYYYSFVNPFLNEMGVANAAGKMSIGQVTEILFMLLLPWILIKFRLKTIIFIGLFLWGGRYLLFVWGIGKNSELLYIIGLTVHGAAYILSTLTSQIYLDTRVPKNLRSTAQGFYSLLTFGVGAFIGSIIAGSTVSYFTRVDGSHQWATIWLIPSIIGLLVAGFFYIKFNSKEKT